MNSVTPETNNQIIGSATTTQSIPTGAIVGICVGAGVILVAIIGVALLLYRKSVNSQRDIWARQLSMLDLKSINLGEAKSSIVSHVTCVMMTRGVKVLTCVRYLILR